MKYFTGRLIAVMVGIVAGFFANWSVFSIACIFMFYCSAREQEEIMRGKNPMTPSQRELARHALGFPNKRNTSYRNRFCCGEGHSAWQNWLNMVAEGYAVRHDSDLWGGDSMFYLTLKGALLAREPKEHLSKEETAMMRELEPKP